MRAKVLVVEDDPDIVDYLSSFLEDEGFEVASATRCSTAHELMDDFKPEVILIDALLPGKSGLDLLVWLRSDPKWSDLPMVVVTGNDQAPRRRLPVLPRRPRGHPRARRRSRQAG